MKIHQKDDSSDGESEEMVESEMDQRTDFDNEVTDDIIISFRGISRMI